MTDTNLGGSKFQMVPRFSPVHSQSMLLEIWVVTRISVHHRPRLGPGRHEFLSPKFGIFDAEFDRSALREVIIFVYFSCKVNVNYGKSRIVDSEPEKDPSLISVDCQTSGTSSGILTHV